MKKSINLTNLPAHQFLAVVYTSKDLTEKLDDLIHERANEELNEQICTWLNGCDYNIGLFNPNHIQVRDSYAFLDGIEEKVANVSASQRTIDIMEKCKKLRQSNLFDYTVKKELYEAIMEEIKQITSHFEALSYSVFCKDVTDADLTEFVNGYILELNAAPFEDYTLNLENGQLFVNKPAATVPAPALAQICKTINNEN